MKIFFILLLVINPIYTRSPMPKSLVVVDCEPRSRLSISVSPDPLVYKKPFEITVKAWAIFKYKEAWGKFDIWWGKGPGNTTRLFSGQGSLCGKTGYKCNGRIGAFLFINQKEVATQIPFPGFYNASFSVYSNNGRRLLCGRLQVPVIEKP
uniref:MD-2-related lipid-recognition domain-containing protein n=1 Tax=Ciona intestinalis TaxID=7719 RepID=H2Y3F8_CIOIN